MSGDAVNDLLSEIAHQVITPVLDATGRQFGYVFYYKSNIKNLEKKAKRLGESRGDADNFFKAQSRNNEERAQSAVGWLNDVDEVTIAAKEVVEAKDKLKGGCLNLKSRYVLSRKSTKLATDIQELQDHAPKIVATNSALPAGMLTGSSSNYASKDFKTRTEIMDKVMEALKNDTINIIGIWGLDGIGKSTILHEVRERARTEELFDEVAMTTVSQYPNLSKIQSDLASMLGLTDMKDNKKNIIERADLLHKRLTNGNKILVVLDDVWSAIELKEVGIPVGHAHARCKVVLASPYESVCANMGTQKTILVQVLSKEEAWHLFKKKAGDCVERERLEKIAKEVADKCGGLPIALVTLAGALSNKKREVWEDARTQLRQSRVTRIPEMNNEVYSSIRLCYNFLVRELPEAQPLLLLCCQHSEAAEINVERLARYCLALELFKNVDKIVDARNSTYAVIDRLKSCFLLEAVDVDEEEKYTTVKMHNVIRDVCLSIVSEVKEERDKVYMHIMAKHTYGGYELSTSKVDYPKLKLLMEAPLDGCSLDKSFLQQMEELRVFESLEGYEQHLPPALEVLENLRMLSLEFNSLSEKIMSTIGSLLRLEILSFWGSSLSSLPRQIGQLSNLKLLDLRCTQGEGFIPSGILPGLNMLEVLCMGKFFLLEAAVENPYNYGRITELDYLSNLTTLQMDLKDPNNLLDLRRFRLENLECFLLGSNEDIIGFEYGRILRTLVGKIIKLGNFVGMKWVLEAKSVVDLQLKDIEDWTDPGILAEFVSLDKLVLENCKHLKYINSTEGSLGKLRVLSLTNMPEMRRLLVGSIDPLCLVNLREVEITKCGAIETIFQHSIAMRLVHLQELRIKKCLKLEGILSEGELGAEITKEPPNDFIGLFPNLRILDLWDLPKLGGFYNLKLDSTVQQPLLNPLVMLPSLTRFSCSGLHQLKQIVGGQMLELSKVAESDWLQNLEHIFACDCTSLEIVFDFDGLHRHVMEENAHVFILGKLKVITLIDLPNLKHVSTRIPHGIHAFENLGSLEVETCGNLGYLISSSIVHMLVNLESLSVRECKSMEEVIKMNEEYAVKKIVFRSLRRVKLVNLEKLSSFYSGGQHAFEFPLPNSPNLRGRVQQPLFNTMVMLPGLKHLECSRMPQLKQIVGGRRLKLSKHGTSDWLQSLEEITVNRCNSLETVFDFVGLHIKGENAHVLTLSQLKSIQVRNLPNLEHLCRLIPQGFHAFQNLKKLDVYSCNNLGYLISSSMAHMLENLESSSVRGCKSMEVVIKMNEDYGVNKIVFHSLTSVKLQYLEKISSFCSSEQQSIEFPSLREVIIQDCSEMKTFCCGHLTVEKLDGVKTSVSDDDDKLFWKGDLNETVRHLNARNRVNQMNSDLKDVTECTNEGTPAEALMPLSNVSPPNASLTPDVVSPSPLVSDNNEELANSASPDLRRATLPPLFEFVPSASMEQTFHSSDSLVQSKADKELYDMSLSSQDDDWKRSRTLIQAVYVQAKLKTTFEEILAAKPNFLSGLRLKTVRMKTEAVESTIRSLQILRQRTTLTISSEELAYIKDSLDDLETSGLDTAWLERGYKRAMLVIKEQKAVSAAAYLAMLEREKTEDEVAFEMAREKLEASTAQRDAFKAEHGALMQEFEAGKELLGGGFDSETSLGDGLLD